MPEKHFMETSQLESLKQWFETFPTRFIGSDDYLNAHLQVKREHTLRTREEISELAERLSLHDNQKRIAEAVALLHDVGRFPQFATYHTFHDAKSVNHCRLGLELLRRERVLESLEGEEKTWIETAVLYHGQRLIPENLNGQSLLFLKLIRDADKLDIFRVALATYRNMQEKKGVLLDLPDRPEVSAEVMEAVLAGRLLGYEHLRTLNDFKLLQIGWIYDINFAPSLEKLRSSSLLEEMFCYLPGTREIAELRITIERYIDSRLTVAQPESKTTRS
jgi:hypothetical protein